MKFITLSFLFCLCLLTTAAQNQNNVWCFGTGLATLDFNSDCTPIVRSDMGGFEGSTTISDPATGRRILFTDGVVAVDTTNQAMPGSPYTPYVFFGESNTKTQNVIIPKPGSSTLYYILSPEVQAGTLTNGHFTPGINCTTVDMAGNNGLGALVTAEVNVHLRDTANTEKLVAVRHGNGTDIWVIGHAYRTNEFFAFLVTASGVDTNEVSSMVGPVVTPYASKLSTIGEMKASPDGTKLAFTSYATGTSCMADFDKFTGQVSNAITLDIGNEAVGGYGVSFSPDNSKLYISDVDSFQYKGGMIWQFDLGSGNPLTIQNSRTLIYRDTAGSFRGMQLGPDGKLYITRLAGSNGLSDYFLAVIHQPNLTGTACNYVHNGIYLNGMRGSWGLNNILDFHFCNGPLGIASSEDRPAISVFPNPANGGIFTVDIGHTKQAKIKYYTMLGETIYESNLNPGQTPVDLSDLPKGIYLYEISNESGLISSGKMVIQ